MSAGMTAAGVTAAASVATAAGSLGSALGSSKSGSANQNGTQVIKGTQTNKGIVTTSTLNPEVLSMLQGLVTNGSFSKQAAITDSANAVKGAIQTTMQQYMPSIAGEAKGSGMSGDSMTQILANQTAVQAAVQGAGVQMNSINNYGSVFTNLINALTAGSPQTQFTDQTQTTDNTQTDTTTNQQTSSGGMSVICTKFWKIGLIDYCTWLADEEHGIELKFRNPEFFAWYMSWAPKVVAVMDKYPSTVLPIWYLFGKAWVQDMAWKQVGWGKPSYYGRGIYAVGKGIFSTLKFLESKVWLTSQTS